VGINELKVGTAVKFSVMSLSQSTVGYSTNNPKHTMGFDYLEETNGTPLLHEEKTSSSEGEYCLGSYSN